MPQLDNQALESFPEYAAARAKLRKIRDDLNSAGLRRDKIKKQIADAVIATEELTRATRVTCSLDRPTPAIIPLRHQLEAIEVQIEAIVSAMYAQKDVVDLEKAAAQKVLFAEAKSRHLTLVGAVAEALDNLARAIDAEAAFREDADNRGVPTASMLMVRDTVAQKLGYDADWRSKIHAGRMALHHYLQLPSGPGCLEERQECLEPLRAMAR